MEAKKKTASGLLAYLKGRGRLWLLVGGAALGILLLVFGGTADKKSEQNTGLSGGESAEMLERYERALEKELESLCEAVGGVGHVSVMVRLECGTQIRYTTDAKGEIVTVGTGSAEQALPQTLLSPKVAGVGIVCRGGNDPYIQQTLTELVSTTLHINTNRVFVTGR